MPSLHLVRPDLQLVVVHMAGRIGFREIVAMRDRLLADPAFDPAYRQVIDLRQADPASLSADDVSRLSQSMRPSQGARHAFVTAGELSYGLFRMYALHATTDGRESEAFRTLEDACRWLGLPLEDVEEAMATG